jgi:dTMP kinase
MGKLITLEGGEGVGKTTNAHFIQAYLERKGHEVVMTREPGGTVLAEEIRGLLLNNQDETVESDTELLLLFAARCQHFNQLIYPALQAGKWVVCDRFIHASYAYQGYGRGLSMTKILTLEKMILGKFQPDLTLLFDMQVEEGLARVRARGGMDRFENEKLDFFHKVREGYLEINQKTAYMSKINAAQPIDEVQAQIKTHLDQLLAQEKTTV